jgi:hypothetical protein
MRMQSALTALGAALALAVTLTTAVAPAFAEAPQFEQAKPSSIVDILDTKPKFEQDKPPPIVDVIQVQPRPTHPGPGNGESGPVFKPDVRVVYLSQSSSGADVTYRFRVENIGAATVDNVGLDKNVVQHQNGGTLAKLQSSGGTIPFLGMGQSQEVTVTCNAFAGYHCHRGTVKAVVASDMDQSNNSAHS